MKKYFYACIILFSVLLPVNGQQKTEDMLLEAMGALSGQNMYLTYLSLGNIADSYASGVYKVDFAVELAAELSEMIRMTIKQYDDMLKSKLIVGDDYNALLKFIDVYTALSEEADGLKAMISTHSEDNIGQFERGRQKAWNLISEILGIQTQE